MIRSLKRKKIAALLLSVFMLAACSTPGMDDDNIQDPNNAGPGNEEPADPTGEGNGEKVVIDFWTFWGSETRRPIIEKIIEDFNSSQDRIEVKHTFLPWGDIWTKNIASISAGNPADVIINDINSVTSRAANNQVMDITEWVKADNLEETFYPELYNTVVYQDKIYALPFVTDTRLLFYNKDAFEEAGLDPEKPPATWAELEEFAKKLDKKNGNSFERVGFHPLWGNFGADGWLLNADEGRSYFDEEGNPIVNTPKKIEALKWIRSWNDRLGQSNVEAYQAEFGTQQAHPFLSGKIAMYVDVATFYTQIRDYGDGMNFGVAPIPEMEEGSGHHSVGGGFVAEIPQGSDNPEEAYEFLKYLTGVEAQSYWGLKNFDNVANTQGNEATLNNSEMDERDREIYQIAVDNLELTKMAPTPQNAMDFKNIIQPHIDQVIIGSGDAKTELDEAQSELERMMN